VVGRKRGFRSHEFSKQKQTGREMVVEAVTSRGKWSEVGRGREVSDEFGRARFQS
jgi:hypothetical protein